jgi:hypothetical protein
MIRAVATALIILKFFLFFLSEIIFFFVLFVSFVPLWLKSLHPIWIGWYNFKSSPFLPPTISSSHWCSPLR